MPLPTEIRNLTVEPLDIPLHKPFGIAGGVQPVAQAALVTVELADGTRGFGEAAPLPVYNGETRDGAIEAVLAARAGVVGEDVRAWRRVAANVEKVAGPGRPKPSGAARCAIETAVLDAMTRRVNMPLWAFFGGAERKLVTDVTISIDSVEEARREAALRTEQGFARLKVKVGGKDDLARVVAVREGAPDAELMLDGNAGMTLEGALDLIADLRARGIVPILFEQPVHAADNAAMEQVRMRGEVHVAADETVGCASHVDLMTHATPFAFQVVNVKLMKYGVAEALDIVAMARTKRLGLMIGGMLEAKLAMSMSACFAAGLGGFHFVDLDTPLLLAKDPFTGGYAQRGAELDLSPIEAGHGVSPRDA